MKKNVLMLMVVMGLTLIAGGLNAQNVAHLNYQEIIQMMPEYEVAYTEYEVYKQSLDDELKSIENEIRTVTEKYQTEASKVSPNTAKLQVYAGQVNSMEQLYQQTQMQNQDSLNNKMAELVTPIKEKIEKVVAEIAKAKGYTHVFDTGSTLMLYADPAYDLSDQVKTKLGLKAKPTANPAAGNKTTPGKG